MQKTYLFYDLETTGLNVAFDQVLQFAAIRTDLQLKEIERVEIRVKLRDDVIPSPYAVLTHLISTEQMQSEGISEFAAIKKIHNMLNKPGTISLGYNTLGFDDEFLRFSFYRNLLTPYTHQYANQCYRMDIYPIALFYYLYNEDSEIKWPTKEGKTSLKLDAINELNNFVQGQAHDAMVDVEATIAVAKQLMKSEKMWDYCVSYFLKAEDQNRLSKLTPAFPDDSYRLTEGIFVQGILGHKNNYQAPVLNLGQHRHYKNQFIFLRLDQEELRQTTLESIDKTTWAMKKKLGEPGFLLPANERFKKKLSSKQLEQADLNKQWLHDNPKILQAIIDHHLDYKYPSVPEADVDSVLYQAGFLSREDQQLCQQFHRSATEDKVAMVNDFSSTETQELAARVIARNFPQAMNEEIKADYQSYLGKFYSNDEIVDYRRKAKFNLAQAEAEVQELEKREDLTDEQLHLLEGYKRFIKKCITTTSAP
jgi:exodeoxyribonuclease-1